MYLSNKFIIDNASYKVKYIDIKNSCIVYIVYLNNKFIAHVDKKLYYKLNVPVLKNNILI